MQLYLENVFNTKQDITYISLTTIIIIIIISIRLWSFPN